MVNFNNICFDDFEFINDFKKMISILLRSKNRTISRSNLRKEWGKTTNKSERTYFNRLRRLKDAQIIEVVENLSSVDQTLKFTANFENWLIMSKSINAETLRRGIIQNNWDQLEKKDLSKVVVIKEEYKNSISLISDLLMEKTPKILLLIEPLILEIMKITINFPPSERLSFLAGSIDTLTSDDSSLNEMNMTYSSSGIIKGKTLLVSITNRLTEDSLTIL